MNHKQPGEQPARNQNASGSRKESHRRRVHNKRRERENLAQDRDPQIASSPPTGIATVPGGHQTQSGHHTLSPASSSSTSSALSSIISAPSTSVVAPRDAPGGGGGASSVKTRTTHAADRQASPSRQHHREDLQTMQTPEEFQILLLPVFSAMTRITDHLFLTGVGGMTRTNFRRHHIDFVVNITTEAPLWDEVETLRIPLEDDPSANILPYLDMCVDRIQDMIIRRGAHVLVHCVAGVSRSATVVIAYLMKYKHMSLHDAFNFCYKLRPVIRPNNGFMMQLINYEFQLFGRNSVSMIEYDCEGTLVNVPQFFVNEHPKLVQLEVLRVKDRQRQIAAAAVVAAASDSQYRANTPD